MTRLQTILVRVLIALIFYAIAIKLNNVVYAFLLGQVAMIILDVFFPHGAKDEGKS